MKFQSTGLSGVSVVHLDPVVDERGLFARSWCSDELIAAGLDGTLAQCSISYNERRGTLRGMHWQREPWGEVKVVRCTRGRIFDVALDLRPESPTRLQWFAIELTSENRLALYIPRGVAHGFQSLDDASEVLYMISQKYHPESSVGARWNDPAFGIQWPISNPILSPRDAAYPDFVK